jgi:hypothetical protein
MRAGFSVRPAEHVRDQSSGHNRFERAWRRAALYPLDVGDVTGMRSNADVSAYARFWNDGGARPKRFTDLSGFLGDDRVAADTEI